MQKLLRPLIICGSASIAGCASIDFDGEGLTYFEPRPHLLVATGIDCVQTARVIIIPGEKKTMKFKAGFGSSALTATLADGMITSVGQTSDTKASELLTAAATVATAVGALGGTAPVTCEPAASLFVIEDGKISAKPAFELPAPKAKKQN